MLATGRISTSCRWSRRPLSTCIQTKHSTCTLSSQPKASHSLDEDCREIMQWLSQKVGVNIDTLLYIGKSSNGGRGLFASKEIKYGDCMFKIPFCAQLSTDNLPQEIKSLVGKEVGNVARLAMVILLEKKLGQHSEWAPYITRLPKIDEMNITIFWTADELEMIQKSALYQETIKKKNLIVKEYLAIKPIFDSFPKFFKDVDLEDFIHACALVESRAWGSTSKGMFMIPFADFLNHDGTSETYLLFDEDKQISEVVSDSSYAPGDEIFIKYAKFSNSTLLLDFGFTLPNNTHDQVQVAFEIPCNDPIRSIKTELLCRHITRSIKDINGFSPTENSFTIKELRSTSGNGKGIPQALRAFARVRCCTSAQELDDLAAEGAENDGRLARRPLRNMIREVQAHLFLLVRINQLIKEYNVAIRSLRISNPPQRCEKHALRRRMAKDLLCGELRILVSASDWLQKYCSILAEKVRPTKS